MSKKPQQPQTGSKRERAKALLKELSSVQALLGDAAEDVPAPTATADNVPGLTANESSPEGDAHSQIPLLSTAENNPSLQKKLKQRQNPFLNHSNSSENHKPTVAKTTAQVASKPAPKVSDTLIDDALIEDMVDDLISQWMPQIEKELRQRLAKLIKAQQ